MAPLYASGAEFVEEKDLDSETASEPGSDGSPRANSPLLRQARGARVARAQRGPCAAAGNCLLLVG